MVMTKELMDLYALLDVYKEKLADVIDRKDSADIWHWENNVRELENKIAGLEYEE